MLWQRWAVMANLRRFLLRLLTFGQRDRAERDAEREIASHLALLEDEYQRRGNMDTRQLLPRTQQGPQPFGIPSIAVRGLADPGAIASHARAVLRELDPAAGIDGIATLEQLMYGSLVRPRFYAVLTGLFAVVAGIIAAVGVYGVLAYSVVQRTTEIGVRMALGAERGVVLRYVLRQGLVHGVIGIVLGTAGAVGLTRYLEGMLYGITPLDVPTYAVIATAFTGVALLASYVPARRATKVDPIVALRCE